MHQLSTDGTLWLHNLHMGPICDAIRQNEFEVTQINFTSLNSCIRHSECAHLAENHMKILLDHITYIMSNEEKDVLIGNKLFKTWIT